MTFVNDRKIKFSPLFKTEKEREAERKEQEIISLENSANKDSSSNSTSTSNLQSTN